MASEQILGERGQLIGRVDTQGKTVRFFDARGRYVGIYVNGQTLDARGRLVGKGNQGMGLIFTAK